MTPVLATVVEGHGEVQAVPVLLRRAAAHLGVPAVQVPPPFRLPRGKIAIPDQLAGAVATVARRVPSSGPGGVLVLADTDDDCPVSLRDHLAPACEIAAAGRRVELAFACREYEAWLLAGDHALLQHPDVGQAPDPSRDYEAIRDAKGALEKLLSAPYVETRHQPGLTSFFDLAAAEATSRSFRHLLAVVGRLLAP